VAPCRDSDKRLCAYYGGLGSCGEGRPPVRDLRSPIAQRFGKIELTEIGRLNEARRPFFLRTVFTDSKWIIGPSLSVRTGTGFSSSLTWLSRRRSGTPPEAEGSNPSKSITEVSKQSMMSGNEMHWSKQGIVCPIERLGGCGEALRNGLHSRKRPAPNSNSVHKSSLSLKILGDHGRYVRCVWLNHWSCL